MILWFYDEEKNDIVMDSHYLSRYRAAVYKGIQHLDSAGSIHCNHLTFVCTFMNLI